MDAFMQLVVLTTMHLCHHVNVIIRKTIRGHCCRRCLVLEVSLTIISMFPPECELDTSSWRKDDNGLNNTARATLASLRKSLRYCFAFCPGYLKRSKTSWCSGSFQIRSRHIVEMYQTASLINWSWYWLAGSFVDAFALQSSHEFLAPDQIRSRLKLHTSNLGN